MQQMQVQYNSLNANKDRALSDSMEDYENDDEEAPNEGMEF